MYEGLKGWLCALALSSISIFSAQLSSFQAGTGGWQLGTLAAGDIIGDAQLEIVVPYRDNNGQWKLDAFDWHGSRLAGFPYNGASSPINVSPTLYDIDGDGKSEIFFTAGASIVALKGNGATLWTKSVSALNYVPDSGFHAITNGFYMSPLGVFQPLLPSNAQFFSEVSSPIIADLAANGTLELLTAWKIKPDPLFGTQDYNPFINDNFGGSEWGLTGETWSGGVVGVNARTGASTLTYHFHQLVEAGLAVGQADDDAAREVYVLNDSDSIVAFDRTQPHGFYGKGMLHKMFGKNQRLLSGSYLTGVDVYAADITGDGHAEALAASSQINPNWQPSETILADDGAILWRKWLQTTSFSTTYGWFNSACMIPVNPDHDDQIDILSFTHSTSISFRAWNGVELVDRPGWPKDFAPRLPTPPVVGDIDGDGAEEIIIGTYDPAASPSTGSLYIFALNGSQKQVITVPGGLKHIPAIADVNNDGSADLIYRALDGKIYVQNFGAKPNAKISWATHRGNMRRDGNMDANLFPPGTPIIPKAAPSNGNLIANGDFEENGDSHWDKWFTGDIPWDRMTVSSTEPASGKQSMEIRLVNDGSQSSITQYSHYGIPESYIKTTAGTLYTFGGYIRSAGLTAPSEHWFEWDSSRTGENPSPRPGLPWPSYFTPSLRAGTSPTPWTYLNRVFTMPDDFPNIEVRHRFTVQGRATGSVFLDDIFFAPLPAPNDSRWLNLMSFGQRWRYSINTPPENWFATDFNDTAWPEAQAKFGSGTGPQNIRTSITAKKPAYYFRRSFTMATVNLSRLLLAATCTDDYGGTVYPMRIFVNGTEIITGGVEAVTGEGNETKYFDLTPFRDLLFADRPNLLAIILQNTWASDWDNIAFDVALKGIAGPAPTVATFSSITRLANGSITLNLSGPPSTLWTLQSCEALGATWQTVQSITFSAAGLAAATDNGQNGRPFPSAVSSRFYRLRRP